MEVLGYDVAIYTTAPLGLVCSAIASVVESMWDNAVVEIDYDDGNPTYPVPLKTMVTAVDKLVDSSRIEFYFCRDDEMCKHFEEFSYQLTSDGSGPFAAIVDQCEHSIFMASDIRGIDVEMWQIEDEAVVNTWIVCNSVRVVSFVVPGDPATDAFSSGIVRSFMSILSSLMKK